MKVDENSMLIWYPKIKDLDIPQPKTEFYIFDKDILRELYDEKFRLPMKEIKKVANKIGYPLFIRTDLSSAKHSWDRSCYVEKEEDLEKHIMEVIEFNLCADIMGLNFKALYFREFIPMDSKFTAFHGKMPVNPERRYFIKEGEIQCHHAYWIEDAIEKGTDKDKLPKNWRELAKEVNTETKEEIKLLSEYVNQISKLFPKGYWSIDFCKAKDGRWILIDMATGERSWHDENCKYYVKPKDLLNDSKVITEFKTIK